MCPRLRPLGARPALPAPPGTNGNRAVLFNVRRPPPFREPSGAWIRGDPARNSRASRIVVI